MVVDATFQVLAANRSLTLLLDGVAPQLVQPPFNAVRVALHPDGLARHVVNLRQWRRHLLARLEHRLEQGIRTEPLRQLYEEVRGYPEPEEDPAPEAAEEGHPFALPLRVRYDGRVLSFLSTIATFNTPLDVTVSELAMETFLPADRETARYLQSVADRAEGEEG